MKRFHIQFDIDVPDDVSTEQAREWFRYMCGDTGSMKENNPLIDRSFSPVFDTFRAFDITGSVSKPNNGGTPAFCNA